MIGTDDMNKLWRVTRCGRSGIPVLVAAFATKGMAQEWINDAAHRSRDTIEEPISPPTPAPDLKKEGEGE